MKRAPMPPRKTPLRPGGHPVRRKALAKQNPRRRAKRERECYGPHAIWIRRHVCPVCGGHPTVAHHVRTRGAGGKAKDLAPLCNRCHDAWHREGRRTFEERRQIDLAALAAEFWAISPAHENPAAGR